MATCILLRSLRRVHAADPSYGFLTGSVNAPLVRSFCSKSDRNTQIGIDFGYSNTRLAVMTGNIAKVIHTSPSLVALNENGQLLFGTQAKHWAVNDPKNTVFGIKDLLGKKFHDPNMDMLPYNIVRAPGSGYAWIEAYGRVYAPDQLASFIIANMKKTAESYFGKSVSKAILTFRTSNFSDGALELFVGAAINVGLDLLSLLEESICAAISYGMHNTEGLIAVFDLGGGAATFSLLQVSNGKFKLTHSKSVVLHDGALFDGALVEFLVSEFKRTAGIDVSEDGSALIRLREASEKAKIELSSTHETNIYLPFIATHESGVKHLDITLTRSKFESLISDLVEDIRNNCENCLKEAGVTAKDVDEVLLVGGMAKVPRVQKLVAEVFGKSPRTGVNPNEASALGAAAYGAIDYELVFRQRLGSDSAIGKLSIGHALKVATISMGDEPVDLSDAASILEPETEQQEVV